MQRWAWTTVAMLALPGCVERLIYEEIKGEDAGEDDLVDHDIECIAQSECEDDQACFEGVCVGTGSLRFSLSWEVLTDFDLHVLTPSGAHLHYAIPRADRGFLDVDDCVENSCVDNQGIHVENIFFEFDAPRGDYEVWVQNFNGADTGSYTIEVAGAVDEVFTGHLEAIEATEGPRHRVTWAE